MRLFDTHAHLDDEQLVADLPVLLEQARHVGVQNVLAVGTTAESSEACVRIAEHHPGVYAAVGIQPNYCAEAQPGDWERVLSLTENEKVVAIGETGLDRYWDFTPFEIQEDYFRRHIQLSQQLDIPFIVHLRDCGEDILRVLDAEAAGEPLRGVMHSFTGDTPLMEACIGLGMYISFAGMVTFKKSDDLRRVAAAVPAELAFDRNRRSLPVTTPETQPAPKRARVACPHSGGSGRGTRCVRRGTSDADDGKCPPTVQAHATPKKRATLAPRRVAQFANGQLPSGTHDLTLSTLHYFEMAAAFTLPPRLRRIMTPPTCEQLVGPSRIVVAERRLGIGTVIDVVVGAAIVALVNQRLQIENDIPLVFP